MSQKYMSFIFDDGPNALVYEMVDKISAYGWKAGFAIIGKKINDETQNQLRYAIDHGFQIVSHGWNHVNLCELNSKQEIVDEMLSPIVEVKRRLNYDIKMARLPFIAYNDLVMQTMAELKLPLLGHGINTDNEWSSETTPERIINAVLNSISDGAVVCMHVLNNTSKTLDVILPELKKQGYTLVTAEELFRIKNIENIPLGININNVNQIF